MKIMVGIVLAILLLAMTALFWPENDEHTLQTKIDVSNATSTNIENAKSITKLSQEIETAAEKGDLMRAAYEELENQRKDLKRQLAKVQHLMWDMKFPQEKASEINDMMLNAHKFEKTPRLLGAFHNVKEIKNEIESVNFAITSLNELELMINEKKHTDTSVN
ncbi:MAG: hypothetical protein AAF410_03560 [Pseudomonadota bacterium]